MNIPRFNADEVRDNAVTVRFSQAEYDMLEDTYNSQDTTILFSVFLRLLLVDLVKEKRDIDDEL